MTSRKRKRARRFRRLGVRISVFLMLGTVVNVGVAWGLAAWLSIAHTQDDMGVVVAGADELGWRVFRRERSGAIRLGYRPMWIEQWEVPFPELDPVPGWSRVSTPPASLEAALLVEDARGWPMHALMCELEVLDDGHFVYAIGVIDGIPLSSVYRPGVLMGSEFYDATALPLRPIWSGFAINTLFYAVVLYGLWSMPLVARRAMRRREGRCATCGYDLRATRAQDPCPECGPNR